MEFCGFIEASGCKKPIQCQSTNKSWAALTLLWSPDGALMFHQVPLVKMDGMNLVQTKAILNYIAGKYNLYGKDIKERAMWVQVLNWCLNWTCVYCV